MQLAVAPEHADVAACYLHAVLRQDQRLVLRQQLPQEASMQLGGQRLLLGIATPQIAQHHGRHHRRGQLDARLASLWI
jgi:hypothetical protein